MTIRRAHGADEAAVRLCAQRAYGGYVAVMGQKPAPLLADYGAHIAAGAVYLATGDDDALQGFIVFFPRAEHMFLDSIAVMPALAGRGIGKSLIALCEGEARRLGLGAVHLYTNEKMADNLLIYPRLGYVEVDRRCEDGFQRVYFEKQIG